VWVELKECLTPAEMVLTNLSTLTTEGQPLQTAGMVLVKATAGGQPLQIAAGRTLRLELPAAHGRPLSDMRLYYGQPTRPIRWEAAPETAAPASEAAETIYTNARPMPTYGNGPADINRLIRYPQEAVASRAEGIVFASFVVDESGRVLRPKILRGLGHGCDEEVLRVLRQTSGHWTPGQRNGEFVKVKMTLPVRFSFQEGMLSAADNPPVLTDPEAQVVAAAGSSAPEETTEPNPTDRYVFNCAQLGWFNADRPLSPGAGAASLLAASPEADDATAVRLVLRGSTPTVLAGQPTEGGYQFESIPPGHRAVLVGLRYQGGSPYLAWQEITTGQESNIPLEFQETTLEDLEKRLDRL
jgi:TonB family protein